MAGYQSIDGLASNLNTTEIINSIMEYERRPVTLMEAQQTLKTNEISTFNALSAKLLALQTSIRALGSRQAFSEASLGVSHEDLVRATANGAVTGGTYALNILSLATNHQIASQGFDDPSQAVMGTGTITLAVGDRSPVTLKIDGSNNSLTGIKKAINDADIGVTATIVDDGSSSHPYRLVLTGDETGQKNKISLTTSLSGGLGLDFETASFDDPEIMDFDARSTSRISLGATASYTGAVNKTFTFTVAGNGAQTVGAGNIVINWTDGDENGSIVVSQADTEIVGPDGLKLRFADGVLTGGDTFQVSAFAPVLQQASDARVSIGSSLGGASPLIVRSETNKVDGLIPGVTLELMGVTTPATGPVTIKTGLDTSGVRQKLDTFIAAYNDVKDFIDNQNKYSSDTKEGGVLLGDLTLMAIQSRLNRLISEPIGGLDKSMNMLSAIGIRTGTNGKLSVRDSAKLSEALENDFEAVLRLFVDSGTSLNDGISFVSSSADIKGGTAFDVDITRAATRGYFQSETITDPATAGVTLTGSNNRMKLRVDGIVSDEIVLSARTYASGDDLARELQTRINADDKIGKLAVTVEWVDLGTNGYLKLSSASYGSRSNVEMIMSITNAAYTVLGLYGGTAHAGDDVAGTINGEKATGKGQVLTGNTGNATTAGLKLLITLTEAQIGSGDEGKITVTKGVATTLSESLDGMTKAEEGVLARKTGGLQRQIDSIKEQIESFDERLALRRESLVKKWAEFESMLSQLQSQQSFLTSQLENITANFSQILGKN